MPHSRWAGAGSTPRSTPIELNYRAERRNSFSRITVLALPNDSAATVDFLDGDDAVLDDADTDTPGHQVDLEVGTNIVRVVVTAQDETTRTYTLTVVRKAQSDTNANLFELILERVDGTPIALSPSVAPSVTGYTARVPFSVRVYQCEGGDGGLRRGGPS